MSLEMLSSGNFRVTVNPQRSRKVCCVLGSPNLAGKALTGRTNRMVKNLPAMPETWVQSLGGGDALEEEMATHSSILAWRIPWTEELAGHSPWGRRVGHD